MVLHLLSGKTVSVLEGRRAVRALSRGADDTLGGVLAPPDEVDGDHVRRPGLPLK